MSSPALVAPSGTTPLSELGIPAAPGVRIPTSAHNRDFPLAQFLPLLPHGLAPDTLTAARLACGSGQFLLGHPHHGVTVATTHGHHNKPALMSRARPGFHETCTTWWPNLSTLLAEASLHLQSTAGLLSLLDRYHPELASAESLLLALANPKRAQQVTRIRDFHARR